MREEDLLYLNISNGRIDAVVYSSDKDNIYAITMDYEASMCSCPSFHFRGICKHIADLIGFLEDEVGLSVFEYLGEKSMARMIQSSLKNYNKLMGGLPIGMITGIYGSPQSLKTTLMTHFGYDIIKYYKKLFITKKTDEEKQNILVIDTEGGFADNVLLGEDEQGKTWLMKLNARFGVKVGVKYYQIDMEKWEDTEPKIIQHPKTKKYERAVDLPLKLIYETEEPADHYFYVIESISLEEIMLLHGREIVLDYGKVSSKKKIFEEEGGGKVTALPQPSWTVFRDINETFIARFVKNWNIGGLLYDSLTNITAIEFSSINQSFPARATVNMLLLGRIQELTKKYNLVTFTSNHLTRDQASYKQGDATGGKPVGHNHKYLVYLKKAPKDANGRIIARQRHPNRSRGATESVVMSNDGVKDV